MNTMNASTKAPLIPPMKRRNRIQVGQNIRIVRESEDLKWY
jgi:hypothetical protein